MLQTLEEGDYEIAQEQDSADNRPEPSQKQEHPRATSGKTQSLIHNFSREPGTETSWPSHFQGNILDSDGGNDDDDDEFERDDSEKEEDEMAQGTQLVITKIGPWRLEQMRSRTSM